MSESGRKVLLAAPRGYCAGVDRAVVAVEKALDLYGAPVYVRKEIVHNRYVVDSLAARGAVFVSETDDVPEGATVVFSAHGVAPSVHEEAAQRNLRTIDATCPLVTKVHNEARRFADEGYRILLIGHEGHEEVEGTMGEAPEAMTLVDGPASVAALDIAPDDKVVWLSQTTLSVDETMEHGRCAARARPGAGQPAQRRHLLRDPEPPDRREEGGPAQRRPDRRRVGQLVELRAPARGRAAARREVGIPRRPGERAGARPGSRGPPTVGVTSGASVPEILVRDVLVRLAELGFDDVEDVDAVEEHMVFALPQELRRDLKAAGKQ